MIIGVINHASVTEPSLSGFKAAMEQYGRREGEDILFIYDGPTTGLEGLTAVAEGLVARKVDLILALSTPAAKAARAAAAEIGIPVVFAPSSDPVASGLVASLAAPGRNITGVSFGLQEARRLELLGRMVSGMKTVLVPFNVLDSSPRIAYEKLHDPARRLGIALLPADVRDRRGVEALATNLPTGIDAIFIPPDAYLSSFVRELSAAAIARGIPLSAPHREGVERGALMSYGFDLATLGHQAARLAEQILRGVPAADLPVETAEFRLTVNVATAHALGITIPEEILRQADLVGRSP